MPLSDMMLLLLHRGVQVQTDKDVGDKLNMIKGTIERNACSKEALCRLPWLCIVCKSGHSWLYTGFFFKINK